MEHRPDEQCRLKETTLLSNLLAGAKTNHQRSNAEFERVKG
jgi:hypothetical protein